MENVNGPEDTGPASPGLAHRDCSMARELWGLQASHPHQGPLTATPELGLLQSQPQGLALTEAVRQQVRPLQMPHPQKFWAAGRQAREAPAPKLFTFSGQTGASTLQICCSREWPQSPVSQSVASGPSGVFRPGAGDTHCQDLLCTAPRAALWASDH